VKHALVVLLGGLATLLAGCGGSSTYPVSGTVQYDGAPIPEGYIAFIPAGPGPGVGGPIANGHYSLRAQAGKVRVEITANKKMPLPFGRKGPEGQTEVIQQYVPERYNAKTELVKDVQAGTNTMDFDLTSK
jgi:hypothetical protein